MTATVRKDDEPQRRCATTSHGDHYFRDTNNAVGDIERITTNPHPRYGGAHYEEYGNRNDGEEQDVRSGSSGAITRTTVDVDLSNGAEEGVMDDDVIVGVALASSSVRCPMHNHSSEPMTTSIIGPQSPLVVMTGDPNESVAGDAADARFKICDDHGVSPAEHSPQLRNNGAGDVRNDEKEEGIGEQPPPVQRYVAGVKELTASCCSGGFDISSADSSVREGRSAMEDRTANTATIEVEQYDFGKDEVENGATVASQKVCPKIQEGCPSPENRSVPTVGGEFSRDVLEDPHPHEGCSMDGLFSNAKAKAVGGECLDSNGVVKMADGLVGTRTVHEPIQSNDPIIVKSASSNPPRRASDGEVRFIKDAPGGDFSEECNNLPTHKLQSNEDPDENAGAPPSDADMKVDCSVKSSLSACPSLEEDQTMQCNQSGSYSLGSRGDDNTGPDGTVVNFVSDGTNPTYQSQFCSDFSEVSQLREGCSMDMDGLFSDAQAKAVGEESLDLIGVDKMADVEVGTLEPLQSNDPIIVKSPSSSSPPCGTSDGEVRAGKDAPGGDIGEEHSNLPTQKSQSNEDSNENAATPLDANMKVSCTAESSLSAGATHDEDQIIEGHQSETYSLGGIREDNTGPDSTVTNSFSDGTNPTHQSQSNTRNDAADDEKENISDSRPPAAAMRKSVRFASTNRMRQFESYRAVSSLLGESERSVDFRNDNVDGKALTRRRRRARSSMSKMRSAASDGEASSSVSKDSLLGTAGPRDISTRDKHDQQHSRKHPPTKKKTIQISLIHSLSHTQILHEAMEFIHRDRDVLLQALLKWCGIFHGAHRGALSSFLSVLPPKVGTRKLLERFHDGEYLDLLEPPSLKGDASNLPSECCQSMEGHQDLSCNSNDTIHMEEQSEVDDNEASNLFKIPLSPPPPVESYLQPPSDEILSKYGLEDDCPYPLTRQAQTLLWKYCLAISGASWHAASLLTASEHKHQTDVAIHWGGGRHHAHANKAGGFCYVSDVVLAIQRLLHGHDGGIDDGMLEADRISIQRNISFRRILYIDIDIHHADAVQAAFYDTDQVLTASFHRHSPGFFPSCSGSSREKGEAATRGFGYNLNVPLPAGVGDVQFLRIYRKTVFGLVKAYDPHAVVLCVGADGLEGDELVSGGLDGESVSGEGWTLSPEGLAECVRIASAMCAGLDEEDICSSLREGEQGEKINSSSSGQDNVTRTESKRGKARKLLILGGGGYTPAQTARTYLLCTAAACEGSRPGMLWSELPRDIPSHDFFPRYGPLFELVSEEKKKEIFSSYSSPSSSKDPPSDEAAVERTEEVDIICQEEVSDCDQQVLKQANRAIEMATLFIDRQREKKTSSQKSSFCYNLARERDEEFTMLGVSSHENKRRGSSKGGGGRRRKKKRNNANVSQQKQMP